MRDDMPLLSQWIKKFDKSKLVEFFGADKETRTPTSLTLDPKSSASANSAISACKNYLTNCIAEIATLTLFSITKK